MPRGREEDLNSRIRSIRALGRIAWHSFILALKRETRYPRTKNILEVFVYKIIFMKMETEWSDLIATFRKVAVNFNET